MPKKQNKTKTKMGKPDWLAALEEACAETSQTAVAKRLGISATTVNRVLAGKYESDTKRMEARVRAWLMLERRCCPHMVGRLTVCAGCQEARGAA